MTSRRRRLHANARRPNALKTPIAGPRLQCGGRGSIIHQRIVADNQVIAGAYIITAT
jgi:hypothetical protein